MSEETFEQMVDRVAGHALMRLIKGDGPWRSIVFGICDQVMIWHEKKKP